MSFQDALPFLKQHKYTAIADQIPAHLYAIKLCILDIQVLMRTSNGDGHLTPEIDSAIVRSYNNSEDGFDEADLTFTDKIPGIKLAVESCKHPNDGKDKL